MQQEVSLEVVIDPRRAGLVDGAVCFETGLTRAQAADPLLYAYEHHGEEFRESDPGALSSLVEDVILGRPMPSRFVARDLAVDTVFAITLFLHRDTATHPKLPAIAHDVDLAHRRGVQGLAHVDPELANLILLITNTLSPISDVRARAQHMQYMVGWVYDFVNDRGSIPRGPRIPQPQTIDVGTQGFVLAELEKGVMSLGWLRLYQQGHLRGVLLGPETDQGRVVVASRKSPFVPFDLSKAAAVLNEIEVSLARPPAWRADELWLYSPPLGTTIRKEDLMEVFLRV